MSHEARPPSQRSTRSLKAFAYDTFAPSPPPRSNRPVQIPPTPPRSSFSLFRGRAGSQAKLGKAPPTLRQPDGASLLSQEVKRDSAIVPSPSTADGTASFEPNLPSIIVVEDGESPDTTERSRTPTRKAESFKGIQTMTPTTTVDDIDLDDLTSDKITFSHRGSLMYSGKKMQDLIAAQGDGENTSSTDGVTDLIPPVNTEAYPKDAAAKVAQYQAAEKQGDDTQKLEAPKQGLVSGRRQPSVQMLQAAIHGGRVLSAEEIGFSLKVRNMYDYGDERAANWTGSIDGALTARSTPDLHARDRSSPDLRNGNLSVNSMRRPTSRQSSRSGSGTFYRGSYFERESTELAGGIEDWDEIDGRTVDRYGFIHQDRAVSRASDTSSWRDGASLQRVATSLRLETEQPRKERNKLRRVHSGTQSTRSVPPRPSGDWVGKKAPASVRGSVRSTRSTASSRPNPFRSKTKKVLAEASDMLTLSPHLADIYEDEDAGKTASALKQKEWAREEKWQKMARHVRLRGNGKGGGMRFEFDTTDPKLIERTWKGIPDRWRATAWHSFLSASAKQRGSITTDEEIIGQFHKLQEMNSADDVQIDVDVPRTVNLHIMFRRRYRGGQRLLFRVLHAVSLYFPDTGYVQGMASLAATLLCYFDEEHAFVMVVRLWQLRGLDQLFQAGFGGLMTCLSEFETQWLRGGDVAQQLTRLGIDSTAYGTRWYLTLFNMSMPFPAQLRVWDVFMLLGDAPAGGSTENAFGGADLDVLHATSAALIDATHDILVGSDFENAMKVLTSFVPIKDEDVLMRVSKAEYYMKKKRAASGKA